MAKGYRPVDRDQPFLFPPDMREWLPADHPVWLVIRVVDEHLDTSAFHARRKTGGAVPAGYDPDMLVTVLVWAYAHGVTSSRDMERLCGTDVAFRVICGGNLPGHSTFARFRADFPGAAGDFFTQVLIVCARLGMGKPGVVALDGMKIAASASKPANRTAEGLAKLARERVAAHAAADAAEDELFGAGRRGDEVPEDAWSPPRLMPVRGGGFIQGYNTQNVPSQDGLIIAAELTGDPVDCPSFEPMLTRAEDAAALIKAHRPAAGPGPGSQESGGIGLMLADAGYCSEANLTCPGPDRLIATGKGRDLEKAARDPGSDGPDWGGPAIQAMRERLKTEDGIAAYRHRGHIAETPHGHIKHNMGLRQLSVRGKRKASAEWTFACAVHNLFKALSTGHLTSQALAALAG